MDCWCLSSSEISALCNTSCLWFLNLKKKQLRVSWIKKPVKWLNRLGQKHGLQNKHFVFEKETNPVFWGRAILFWFLEEKQRFTFFLKKLWRLLQSTKQNASKIKRRFFFFISFWCLIFCFFVIFLSFYDNAGEIGLFKGFLFVVLFT